MILFVITASTAPVIGVAFGGWLIDRVAGGFTGAQRPVALRIVVLFGLAAISVAFPATFVPSAGLYVASLPALLGPYFGLHNLR